ncbi:MAG: YidB family protein [Candidatus Eisenbacteria bacterium]|nr:YidB family protein [Candidatus Eisenbacteria bacterium]
MGFLDGLLKQVLGGQGGGNAMSGMVEMVTKNPQILAALTSLLSTRDAAVGGSGGLGGLVGAFQKQGLGDMISSWISTGPNPQISTAQLTEVLGGDTINQFAKKAGVPVAEAGSLLAGMLPALIDHLTPDGKMPDTDSLEGSLSSLLAGLGR